MTYSLLSSLPNCIQCDIIAQYLSSTIASLEAANRWPDLRETRVNILRKCIGLTFSNGYLDSVGQYLVHMEDRFKVNINILDMIDCIADNAMKTSCGGNMTIVKQVFRNCRKFHIGISHVIQPAVRYEQLHIIMYIDQMKPWPNDSYMYRDTLYVIRGSLLCMIYLVKHSRNVRIGELSRLATTALQDGKVDCLRYLWNVVIQCSCHNLVKDGRILWNKKFCQFCESATKLAIMSGQVASLRYVHSRGCPWTTETTALAAEYGHLNCLAYAYEHGCLWNWKTPERAANNGHLDCLQYAHKHGCTWTSETTLAAARNGHLECLKYAHKHGCYWHPNTIKIALTNGYYNCVGFAIENGCK